MELKCGAVTALVDAFGTLAEQIERNPNAFVMEALELHCTFLGAYLTGTSEELWALAREIRARLTRIKSTRARTVLTEFLGIIEKRATEMPAHTTPQTT